MKKIHYIRCDDRLIHGQVIYKWLDHLKRTRVIIVDDEVANDAMEKRLFQLTIPKTLDFHIEDRHSFIASADLVTEALVLCKNLETVVALKHAGFFIDQLLIGRIPAGLDRKKAEKNIYLSAAELTILDELLESGTTISAQTVPDDQKIMISERMNRYYELF